MTTETLSSAPQARESTTDNTSGQKFTPNLIAVLGAGVMGAQIAAHFANCGQTVLLFDLDKQGSAPRSTATGALKTLKKLKPSPLMKQGVLKKLIPCNYELDLEKLKGADFIIEAIAENMDIKKRLYDTITPFINSKAIFATNTSGLSINQLAQTLPEDLRPRFLGVHFFNPPRYMTLVETITHKGTNADLVAPIEHYLTFSLGKNIVRAPDSPNFIANRLGVFSLLSIMNRATQMNIAPDLVDALTGTLLYRPKSATYFTVDVVGLDITKNVVQTMADNLTTDPWHDQFQLPTWIEKLIANKALGMKTRKGCYSKVKGSKVVFDSVLGDYRPLEATLDPEIVNAAKIQDPTERFKALMTQDNEQAKFIQACFYDMAAYALYHAQDLAQTTADIDLALRWGFGWQFGIFETMQMLGFETTVAETKKRYADLNFDTNIEKAFDGHKTCTFATGEFKSYRDQNSYGKLSNFPTFIKQDTAQLVKDFSAAKLNALCDNVWQLSLTTKNLVISDKALAALIEAIDYAKTRTGALVLGPNGDNFAFGADLKMVLGGIKGKDWDSLHRAVKMFQETSMKLTSCPIPVVAAAKGMALGGGCEFVMQSQHRVLARETYIGLVEVGVGLIPAAGGCVTMIKRSFESEDREEYLFEAYKRMMTAQVSASAYQAQEFGYATSSDIIVPHADMLVQTAHDYAKFLSEQHQYPQAPMWVEAPKDHAWALMESWRVNAFEGGFLHEHENHIAKQLAALLGGRSWSQGATEQQLFDLEFDIFMNLLRTETTANKIEHMLTTGKPLRA